MSRHPNYLGEILLWSGVCLSAMSSLRGPQHLAILSPVMVALLITKVSITITTITMVVMHIIQASGIPILERNGEEKWGQTEEYRRYLRCF